MFGGYFYVFLCYFMVLLCSTIPHDNRIMDYVIFYVESWMCWVVILFNIMILHDSTNSPAFDHLADACWVPGLP